MIQITEEGDRIGKLCEKCGNNSVFENNIYVIDNLFLRFGYRYTQVKCEYYYCKFEKNVDKKNGTKIS